jgi:hypothetical protein
MLFIALFPILSSSTSLAQINTGSGSASESPSRATGEGQAGYVLSRIDESVVKELQRAWGKTSNGPKLTEALVLVFRRPDGSIKAEPGGYTNEAYQFTFKWDPATIAVIHTHCNNKAPEPQPADIKIAEKFGVPMFTITLSGMYLYDPATKRISKVLDGLNWLKLSSWAKYSHFTANDPVAMK